MVRKGTLAFLVIGLVACTQGVDDPANFTVGNSNSNGSTTTGATTSGANDTDSASGVADQGNSATTTSGPADSTTSGNPGSTSVNPTTGMSGNCGNGILDAGEQCEGDNLHGFDCASLGLNSGTLLCDPVMCTFDTSMCMSTSGGSSG